MPLYSDGVLEQVRNSVSIVALVSEYVALKKRGRNHVARCPFHTEKTPSFNVSEEKQIFMCFGCGVGGDVFKFIMQIEHLSFPESVRFIAERHGIALPEVSSTEEPGTSGELLYRALAETCSFFHRALLDSDEGRAPLAYLVQRGITRATIDRFQLGYAPAAGNALMHHLQTKDFPVPLQEECGLLRRSEDGRPYDAFRGRVMFPIVDVRGRVIAFGGRALGDRQPKYLNSPETRLYNKSRNLFGLHYSREGIKRADFAVLVEGYMDFVIPFQHGVENLVASLGTSLTPQQVQLLGRYTREVVVSYDPDSAGLAAAQRSLDLFLEEDFRVKVLRLPDGRDPDAFIREMGVGEYRKRLRDSAPYLDFVLDAAIQSHGSLDNPRNKVQVLDAVLPYLAKLPNAVERSGYVSRFAQRLRIEDQQLLAEVRRAAQQRKPRLPEARLAATGELKYAEKRLLQVLLGSEALQRQVLPRCSAGDFAGLATARIFAVIMEDFLNNHISTFDSLHRRFAGEAEQALLARLQIEEVPEDLSGDAADSYCNALQSLRLSHRKQEILREIDEAAQRNDDEMVNRLIEQRVRVDRELVSLSRK